MTGRVSAFADPEILHLAKSAFVPACADDWYQRRRKDAEGEFWKKIVRQGPRSIDAGTHQGIYVLTADGELLAFKNAGQDAAATRKQLAEGLQRWNALPADRRSPETLIVEPHGRADPDYTREPPTGGLILRAFTRILDRKGDGFVKGSCEFAGGDRAARDFLWLTAGDVKEMKSLRGEVGTAFTLPDRIVDRILRFNLLDNTRGESEFWHRDQIRSKAITVTVRAVTPTGFELQLDGVVSLASDRDPSKADIGLDAKLLGKIRVSSAGTIERFDLAVLGEHWGEGKFTKVGNRPGRQLLGFWFEIADGTVPANRVAPGGVRDLADYYRTD